jgi:hypothetical protein
MDRVFEPSRIQAPFPGPEREGLSDDPLGVDGKRLVREDLCLRLAGCSGTMVNMKVRSWGGGVLLLESVP